ENALQLAEVPLGGSFSVGGVESGSAVNLVVPPDVLDCGAWSLVSSSGEWIQLRIPQGASGVVEGAGAVTGELATLRQTLTTIDGGHLLPLALGTRVTLELGTLRFCIEGTVAQKPLARSFVRDYETIAGFWGAS